MSEATSELWVVFVSVVVVGVLVVGWSEVVVGASVDVVSSLAEPGPPQAANNSPAQASEIAIRLLKSLPV